MQMQSRRPPAAQPPPRPERTHATAPAPAPASASIPAPEVQEPQTAPGQFLLEYADPQARYYRASDDGVQAFAALYSDGRIRVAGASDGRRLAGLLQNDRGEVLEIGSGQWSRVYVRPAPDGRLQLEIHGGAYDAHVLTCEPLDAAAIAR